MKLIAAMLVGLVPTLATAAHKEAPSYFELGPRLVQEFRGTYEFKYKRIEFTRSDSTSYLIRSSGDQSQAEGKLTSLGGYTYWVLSRSGEKWLKLKNKIKPGSHWQNQLRGWNQSYLVAATNLTVSVPAGEFKNCAKISISWVAHEPDMEGQQKIVLYLAPGMGVVKKEVYSGGALEHEEALTSYTVDSSK